MVPFHVPFNVFPTKGYAISKAEKGWKGTVKCKKKKADGFPMEKSLPSEICHEFYLKLFKFYVPNKSQ